MTKTKKLIIFGTGDFAQIAYEYFTHDSEFAVCAFCVDQEYLPQSKEFMGLPIYSSQEITSILSTQDHYFYAAIVYGNLNDIRTASYQKMKSLGYKPASYISSKAFVWQNCKIGEHVFIFENNVVQPFVEVGNNVVMWSGNHIGHHSKIDDNCFISSHVVISGNCEISKNCFFGVNCTIGNNLKIGERSWISHGSIIGSGLAAGSITKSQNSEIKKLNEKALFRSLGNK